MSSHYNADNSYLFVNRKEIFKFKANNKNVNFPTQFCLGSISNGFSAIESREVSLNWKAYDFSVDYNPIDRSGSCNSVNDLSTKVSVPNKTKDIDVKVFNMIKIWKWSQNYGKTYLMQLQMQIQ